MTQDQEASLLTGGDCFTHYHSEDRRPTADFLHGLNSVERETVVTTSTYTITSADDHVAVSTTCTVTLPLAKRGQIYTVTRSGSGLVTVVTSGMDTVCGDTSVQLTVQWMSLTFKATSSGWIII